jgi:hypothetical protein
VQGCRDILEELNLMTVERQMEMREILRGPVTKRCCCGELRPSRPHIDEVCRARGLPAPR